VSPFCRPSKGNHQTQWFLVIVHDLIFNYLIAPPWVANQQPGIRRYLSVGSLMFTTLQIDTKLLDPLMVIRLGESGPRIGAR
jgi:hypothetical protein